MDLLGGGEGDADNNDGNGFTVNAAYARRFEHNQRRAELHRLQEKHGERHGARLARRRQAEDAAGAESASESSSSPTDSEMDERELVSAKQEDQILATIMKIRAKDPSVYDKDAKFYDSEEEGGAGAKPKRPRKAKPVYLKDYIAKRALEEGAEALGASDEEDEAARPGTAPTTYREEQEGVRQDFLAAAAAGDGGSSEDEGGDGDEGDGGFGGLSVKAGAARARDDWQPDPKLLSKVFGRENREDEFLKNFIANRSWVEEEDAPARYRDMAEEVSDEEEIDRQERFETAYNFRFEEPGGAKIQVHPRVVDDSVRKQDSKRKRQRAAKAEREQEAKRREAEELKRLKNLKKAEIADRLKSIQQVAGLKAEAGALDALDLEEDFDSRKFDAQMARLFSDGYYADEDDEKPTKLEDDPALQAALAAIPDDEGGFAALARDRSFDRGTRAAGGPTPEDVRGALEEYYNLDYEDRIGDIKCRFNYTKVSSDDYGLDAATVLAMSDKELNQVVSIKKLAPYRDPEKRKQWKNWNVQWKQEGGKKGKWRPDLQWKNGKPADGPGATTGAGAPAPLGEKEARIQAYQKPVLPTDKGGAKARKRKAAPAPAPAPGPGDKTGKGFKKRQKRAEKRAKKRAGRGDA